MPQCFEVQLPFFSLENMCFFCQEINFWCREKTHVKILQGKFDKNQNKKQSKIIIVKTQ